MARRFRGESTCKVDAKGRFTLPPQFRRTVEGGDPNHQPGLKPELVIVYGNDDQDFLECYTIEAMDELDAKIDRLPSTELKRDLIELYSSYTMQTDIDNEGRLLLSPKLREKLGISKEVYVKAWADTFRIWHKDVHDEKQSERQRSDGGLKPGVDPREALDAALADLDR